MNDREGGGWGRRGEVIGTYDKRPRGGKNPGRAGATGCQAMPRHSDRADSSLSDGFSSSAERTTCKFVQGGGVLHEPDGRWWKHIPGNDRWGTLCCRSPTTTTMSGSRKFVSLGMFIIDEFAFMDAAGKPTGRSLSPQGGSFPPRVTRASSG